MQKNCLFVNMALIAIFGLVRREVVSSSRETKIVNVRSATVYDVSHSRWCGNLVTQDLLARNTVAALHSSSTTLRSGVVEGAKWMVVAAFHLSIAVTPLVMRTGKGRETGTGCSEPFVQPKRRPRDVSWSHLLSGTWGESETLHEHDGNQINFDATVRPVTLQEGWTVVLNSLRQVVYCHVKSGVACFQMPENPELLDDLKFENGKKISQPSSVQFPKC